VSQFQKGKTNLDFTEARDSEWQWHHLGHMQVYALLLTDNHASRQHHHHCLCPYHKEKFLCIEHFWLDFLHSTTITNVNDSRN